MSALEVPEQEGKDWKLGAAPPPWTCRKVSAAPAAIRAGGATPSELGVPPVIRSPAVVMGSVVIVDPAAQSPPGTMEPTQSVPLRLVDG